jgi:hypothetical protein
VLAEEDRERQMQAFRRLALIVRVLPREAEQQGAPQRTDARANRARPQDALERTLLHDARIPL